MPYKDKEKRREYHKLYARKARGYKGPLTHCKNGHEFTPENTYVWRGHRYCRKCGLARVLAAEKRDPNHLQKRRDRRQDHRVPSDSSKAKRNTLLKSVGWTFEMFEKTLIEQGNKCAICGKAMNLKKKQNHARACADHEHVNPPKPRGILCSVCNMAFGLLKEDLVIMQAMIAYTLKHREGG